MCSCEGSLQAVVLDDGAASLGIAHRPNIGHTQRVAALLSTDILQHKQTQKTLKLEHQGHDDEVKFEKIPMLRFLY